MNYLLSSIHDIIFGIFGWFSTFINFALHTPIFIIIISFSFLIPLIFWVFDLLNDYYNMTGAFDKSVERSRSFVSFAFRFINHGNYYKYYDKFGNIYDVKHSKDINDMTKKEKKDEDFSSKLAKQNEDYVYKERTNDVMSNMDSNSIASHILSKK